MKTFTIAVTAGSLLLAGAAYAKGSDAMTACAAQWRQMKVAKTTDGQTYKDFSKTCMATSAPAPAPITTTKTTTTVTAAPAPPPRPAQIITTTTHHVTSTKTVTTTGGDASPAVGAPAGATAKCKDGTWSLSAHHSGSCSKHGGVASYL